VPTSDLMLEGLTLMVFGMGFVFTFLTLLVLATKTMSAIVLRLTPVEEVALISPLMMVSPSQQVANDPQLMAVLSAAVHRYRQQD
jgi:oxaloacetate decarboxylase gamma subunit